MGIVFRRTEKRPVPAVAEIVAARIRSRWPGFGRSPLGDANIYRDKIAS